MSQELSKMVEEINAQLRAFGREAVQEIKMMKDGKAIGQVRYGYKPQYVIDAVNNVLMPENWRYEVVSKEIFDNQVVADVQLFIRVKDEWFCKGAQTGQMQIVKGNVGDAMKGAITGAIQKCLSLLSIGSDAYKGLLKNVYLPSSLNTKAEKIQADEKPADPSGKPSTDLPEIAGVTFENHQGVIVAIGERLFDKKELLKAAGFLWNKTEKSWMKAA